MPTRQPPSAFHYPPTAAVAGGAALPWLRTGALFAGLHLLLIAGALYSVAMPEMRTLAGQVVMVSLDAGTDGGRPESIPPTVAPTPLAEASPPPPAAAATQPLPPPVEDGNTAAPEIPVAATAVASTTASESPATNTAAAALPVAATPGASAAAGGADKAVADNYFGQLKRWLDQNKRYPVAAKKQKQQGVAVVTFTIDRRGQLLSSRIQRSSGHAALDEAALALLARAAPMPRLPDAMTMQTLTLTLPIDYSLITQ